MTGITVELSGRTLANALEDETVIARLESTLPAFLLGQRWFTGRVEPIQSVRVEHVVPVIDDGSIVVLLIAVTAGATKTTRYQLPLQADGAGVLSDPLLGEAASRFRDVLLGGERWGADGVRYAGSQVVMGRGCEGAPRPLGVEQSNSSIAFGDRCILKLFRVVQDGVNPDVQLTTWLSGSGAFPHVAPVIATARLQTDDFDADAAVLQEFIANDGDGWQWAIARAREAFANAADVDGVAGYLHSEAETLAQAGELGRLTAEMHAALARAEGSGMRPEPAGVDDWRRWQADLRTEARTTAAILESSHGARAARIARLAQSAIPAAPIDLGLKTRIHGDLHLGQLLHTERGWFVLDFEGEPTRPLAERIALQHPLVDVAGMVRSWDYAARTAGEGHSGEAVWADAVSRAYLDAYWQTADATPRAFLPVDARLREWLLDLFLLRKALYEVRYELGSRPDWVATPLAAVEAMLEDKV